MSAASNFSNRSARSSSGSVRSNGSVKSNDSGSSWFSIGSMSNFQAGKIVDNNAFSKPLRVRKLILSTGTFST